MYCIGKVEIDGEDIFIAHSRYENGRNAVILYVPMEGEYCRFSVNVREEPVEADEFLAKTWMENEDLRPIMLATGLFEDTCKRVKTGFVEAEVWRFTEAAKVYPIAV